MSENIVRAPSPSGLASEGKNRPAKYVVGQKVVVSQWISSHRGVELRDGEVTKIGRKWITVQTGGWSEDRFDLEGRSEQGWGHPTRLWPSRDAYEADKLRRETWDKLHALVRQHSHAPKHLTTQQIADVLAILSPPPSEERP